MHGLFVRAGRDAFEPLGLGNHAARRSDQGYDDVSINRVLWLDLCYLKFILLLHNGWAAVVKRLTVDLSVLLRTLGWHL